jgi:ADP-heptose:LPS heptosyltransferase
MPGFLIIQTAFIGDVILATPLIEKLHQYYPEARIDFLLRKGNEELLAGHPYVNNLLVWDKKRNKYSNLANLIRKIRKTRYDYVINLQRFASSGIVTMLSKAGQKYGFDKNPLSVFFTRRFHHVIGDGRHEVNRNLELIASLTDDDLVRPVLYPSRDNFEKVKEYQQSPYICIAPASVWFTKQFPAEKWIELINNISSGDLIFLLGSPDDIETCDKMLQAISRNNAYNLCGKLTLMESAALMKNAVMNYVNDSAPLHLASAVNASVTAIFCSTVPDFGFGPLSDKSRVVETKEKLDCRPCGLHGFKACPEGHFKCATTIKTEQLLWD